MSLQRTNSVFVYRPVFPGLLQVKLLQVRRVPTSKILGNYCGRTFTGYRPDALPVAQPTVSKHCSCHYSLSPTFPCCHGNKNWVFDLNTKLAVTRPLQLVRVDSCNKLGGFDVGLFHRVIQICSRPTSVTMVTKSRLFGHV